MALICVRQRDFCNNFPIFVCCLQVVSTHDYQCLYAVVVGTVSFTKVEFHVANSVLHVRILDVVAFEAFFVAVTIVVEWFYAFSQAVPCGMPECTCIAINQGTYILSFRRIAVGRRHLFDRSNNLCSDKVLSSCHSCQNFSAKCIVLCNQEVVVLDEFELFKELSYFLIRNFLEIPFAGVLVSCSFCVESSHPEAKFLVNASIYAQVAPR